MARWPELLLVVLLFAGAPPRAAEPAEPGPATTQPAPATVAAPLPPWHARYEVLRNGSPLGEATMSLKPARGDQWVLETHTRGTRGVAGLSGAEIFERSTFRWREGQPELVRYEYRQQIAWRSRERSLRWSDDGAKVLSRAGDGAWEFAQPEGIVMDRHTVALAVAAAVARGVEDARYLVADRDELEPMRFVAGPRETVSVPAGRWEARRVERIRNKPGRTTTSWLAADLAYMPVRMLQVEPDGETLELRLAERLPVAVKAMHGP